MARRLLTTLHVSQFIDPSVCSGLACWPRDPGELARRAPSAAQSLSAVRRAAEGQLRRELDPKVTGVIFEAAELDSRLRVAACTFAARGHRQAAAWHAVARAGARSLQQQRLLEPERAGGHPSRDRRAGDAACGRPRRKHPADDVLVQSRVLPGLTSPYISRIADLAGRLTRRPIPEGTAVTADALDAPLLIHRGQSVILAARAGGSKSGRPEWPWRTPPPNSGCGSGISIR